MSNNPLWTAAAIIHTAGGIPKDAFLAATMGIGTLFRAILRPTDKPTARMDAAIVVTIRSVS
jgi:hypothetical protein